MADESQNAEAAPVEEVSPEAVSAVASPADAPSVEAAPAEAAPADAAPADAAPAEAAPAEAAHAETAPTEVASAEEAHTETAAAGASPVEAGPAEVPPAEIAPSDAAPGEPVLSDAVPAEVEKPPEQSEVTEAGDQPVTEIPQEGDAPEGETAPAEKEEGDSESTPSEPEEELDEFDEGEAAEGEFPEGEEEEEEFEEEQEHLPEEEMAEEIPEEEEIPVSVFDILDAPRELEEPIEITVELLKQIKDELQVITLCWPDITDPGVFEGRVKFPESYLKNNHKEKILLLYAENFRRQFVNKYPHRKPLIMSCYNACGQRKMICTSLRPTYMPYMEIQNWDECAKFVGDHLQYETMQPPTIIVSYSITL